MKIFITGIGTDVGKTIVAAIVTEALQADYWKPIQSGDLDNSDTDKVQRLVSNSTSQFFENAFALQMPASPHLSAKMEDVTIELNKIKEPKTQNHLVIEGAGGVFVPLNHTDCVIDLIQEDYKTIVVSRHYLGSINHTLLTVEALRHRNITISGIVFSGDENASSEDIILKKTGLKMIGRIATEPYFDKNVIKDYADLFSNNLLHL